MGGRENPEVIWANSKLRLQGKTNTMTVRELFTVPLYMSLKDPEFMERQLRIEIQRRKISADIDYVMTQLVQIQETCKEGFFINETLNMLRWFFQKRRGFIPDQKFGMYEGDKRTAEFYQPAHFALSESKSKMFERWKTQIGMIDLLTKLDQLKSTSVRSKTKPTKFIMFACVRKEASEVIKTASEDTLKFAM